MFSFSGSVLCLLSSRMSPAPEKRRSTAVEVAGGVRNRSAHLMRASFTGLSPAAASSLAQNLQKDSHATAE